MTDNFEKVGYGDGVIPFGSRPAVLVVDFQKGEIEHPAVKSIPLIESAVEQTQKLVQAARTLSIPIFHSVIEYKSDLSDFGAWKYKCVKALSHNVEGSRWVGPHPNLYRSGDRLVKKRMPSAFFETDLAKLLKEKKIDTLIVAGCATSGCIRASVIDGFSHGFLVHIARECVGDYDQTANDQNLLDMQRRYAQVVSLSELLREINRRYPAKESAEFSLSESLSLTMAQES